MITNRLIFSNKLHLYIFFIIVIYLRIILKIIWIIFNLTKFNNKINVIKFNNKINIIKFNNKINIMKF